MESLRREEGSIRHLGPFRECRGGRRIRPPFSVPRKRAWLVPGIKEVWRREWDSNPRMLSHRRFSRPVLSTTQPSLRARKSMTDSNAGLILPHSVPPVNEFLNCRACFFALCRENGEKREGKDCTNRRYCAILCISRGVSTDCLYAARGQWAHAFMYNRDAPEVHSLPVLPS